MERVRWTKGTSSKTGKRDSRYFLETQKRDSRYLLIKREELQLVLPYKQKRGTAGTSKRRVTAATSSKTGKRDSRYFLINREEGQQVLPHKQGRGTAGTSS
jgi:hypothetical protein